MSETAAAQSGITVGFAVDGSGLVPSSAVGEEIGRYLEGQLSMPVKVRSFAAEAQLYNWLSNFHEVDAAWLSDDFLGGVPAGQLYSVARNLDDSPGLLHGEVVARQGLNPAVLEQVRLAFLKMHESAAGKVLLSQVNVSRFVSPQ
ncbi:MAG: hypothetical protein OEL80_02710, partial [Desulfuromonadales bacterium]|nr:hypothetical protein [Desulfuromonadales bacterium]